MNNNNLKILIEGINQISLNHEDLMDVVLEFSRLYTKNNPNHALIVDDFFGYGDFIDQALMAAREGIVLAMNAITLDEKINFKELIIGCVNFDHQRYIESKVCADDQTKEIMQRFLRELRKEVFSRIFSQNKDFERISKISKNILNQRYAQFMSQDF